MDGRLCHGPSVGEVMGQLELLSVPEPAQPEGIDLRCCGVAELLANLPEAPALIVADPPWSYTNDASQLNGCAGAHYETISDGQIARVLADSYAQAKSGGRLALWLTWPKLQNWIDAVGDLDPVWPWRFVSGGAWTKTGGPGIGFHWLGNSEPVIVYCKDAGSFTNSSATTSNAHTSPRQKHSEKPVAWMAQWIERWTEPGDLVCDLFAGMAPLARACAQTGRRYAGAEIDPERYRQAVDRLALGRSV